MAGRTRKKSIHGFGRKPFYKEHRMAMAGDDAATMRANEAPVLDDPATRPIGDPNSFMGCNRLKSLTVSDVRNLHEEDARALFRQLRWHDNDGMPYCPKCGTLHFYQLGEAARELYKCARCHHKFTDTSGTLFSGRKAHFGSLLIALVAMAHGDTQSNAARLANLNKRSTHSIGGKIRAADVTAGKEFKLDHARYMGAGHYSTRTWWTEPEANALRQFAEQKAEIAKVADALGRSPSSIAWYARDHIGFKRMPGEWVAVLPRYKSKYIAHPRQPGIILQFPYIQKKRDEHADLLAVNALVPKSLPSWSRADICQSVLLALWEGKTTLDELKVNREKVRWFIAKFYKDQMPHQEVTVGDSYGQDEREYYDRAVSLSERADSERNSQRLVYDTFRTFAPPTQLDRVYDQEVSSAHWKAYSSGRLINRDDAEAELDAGEIDVRSVKRFAGAEKVIHFRERTLERYGIELSDADILRLTTICARSRPRTIDADHELHVIRWGSVELPIVFNRANRLTVTVLECVPSLTKSYVVRRVGATRRADNDSRIPAEPSARSGDDITEPKL